MSANLRNFKRIFLWSFFTALLAVPFSAGAQFTPGMGINVALEPPYPAPGENISVMLSAYTTNLNEAYIEWSVDGVLRQQGTGQTSYTITAPAVGVTRTVDISMTLASGEVATQKVAITPAEVTIFEQAESYTPPFYKGRSLTSPQSSVMLIAFPNIISRNGTRLGSSNLVFTWKKNGRVLGDQSGTGKNTLIIEAPRVPGETTTISVQASTADKSVTASTNHTLTVHNPEILFYENNPLLGVMLNKAIRENYVLSKDEVSIVAYPYFFESSVPTDGKFSYEWRINNSAVGATGARVNEMVLRSPNDQSGVSTLSLAINNTRKLFEAASRSIQIQFGTPQRGINFGF